MTHPTDILPSRAKMNGAIALNNHNPDARSSHRWDVR